MLVCTIRLPVIVGEFLFKLSVILGGKPVCVHASCHASGIAYSLTATVGIGQLWRLARDRLSPGSCCILLAVLHSKYPLKTVAACAGF